MQAYYLKEFVRIVLALLPISFVLFGMIFLRRQERTSQTFWLQSLAGLWLGLAATSRLVLSTVVGIDLLPKDRIMGNAQEAQQSLNFYFSVSTLLHFAELAAFTLFGMALVLYFHERLPKKSADSESSPLIDGISSSSDGK